MKYCLLLKTYSSILTEKFYKGVGDFLTTALLLFFGLSSVAQNPPINNQSNQVNPPDTSKLNLLVSANRNGGSGDYLTLGQCIAYALIHQPALNIATINIDVARANNAVNLSGLLPQVSASGSLIHYIQESENSAGVVSGTTGGTTTTGGTSTTGGTTTTGGTGTTTTGGTGTTTTGGTGTNSGSTTSGVAARNIGYSNTFIPGITVSQAIFSPSLLYAYRSAPLYIQQAKQATDSTKIYLVSSVSKSFYNLLLTLEQINVYKEDTARLGRNLRDAYYQYKGGIVDETDYEEAEITLNNSKAQLKQATENVVPQYAVLKRLMGYPPEQQFNVNFDTLQMMNDIHIDTNQQLKYEKRIELQEINTSKALQAQTVKYYRHSFLPTISAFYDYNLSYENSRLTDLFINNYPSSLVGLSFNIPIFTGFSRINNLRKARLQSRILDYYETDLKSQIYSEYTSALANYKSNYYNLQLLQKNVSLARRTYFVVNLQYRQGIVAYLNVITAESNLITAEISYLNALFQVLSSKIDLQKAMGNITYN